MNAASALRRAARADLQGPGIFSVRWLGLHRRLSSSVADVSPAADTAGGMVLYRRRPGGLLRFGVPAAALNMTVTSSAYAWTTGILSGVASTGAYTGGAIILTASFLQLIWCMEKKRPAVMQLKLSDDRERLQVATLSSILNRPVVGEVALSDVSVSHSQLREAMNTGRIVFIYINAGPEKRRLTFQISIEHMEQMHLKELCTFVRNEDLLGPPEWLVKEREERRKKAEKLRRARGY